MLDWLLFIYTLPSQPSRKRAYVWRELKKLGSVYLRDGVAVLPRRPDLEVRMRSVVTRVEEYGGSADLVLSPRFEPERERWVIDRLREDRQSEYRELHHASVRFLRDVLDEVDEDDFGFPDVDKLEGELTRLKRWFEQIKERDYFDGAGSERVAESLAKCERAFDNFVARAHERTTGGGSEPREDAFERLRGPSLANEADLDLPV